jgi:hypothetical protein
MAHVIAESATGVDASLIGTILQSAGTGTAIIVVLLLLGIINTKSYTDRVEKEADRWHDAYDAKNAEVTELRAELAVQAARAEAAVAAAQRTADVLDRLQMRAADVAVPPPTELRQPRRS